MGTGCGFYNAIRVARGLTAYSHICWGKHAMPYAILRVKLMSVPPMANTLPPETFQQTMQVPEAAYRSAIAIKHNGRMTDVRVTFVLESRLDQVATYAAQCPRCNEDKITVAVPLNPDGSFVVPPACPMLCLACEDRMDAILESDTSRETGDEPSDRIGLNQFIRTMNIRSWD
jgi:hypothetical protein